MNDTPNNTHNLTPDQIGVPEYRLLLRSEIHLDYRRATPEIQAWNPEEQRWASGASGFAGTLPSNTYRVPASVTPERLRALRGIPEGPQIIDVQSEVLPPAPDTELAALRKSLHEALLGARAMETAHGIQAARIEALEAENARLRAGVREIRELAAPGIDTFHSYEEEVHEVCERLLSPEAGA